MNGNSGFRSRLQPLSWCPLLQIVGIGTSQSAAQAVSSLVGGPSAAASPGPPDAITSALAGMTRKQLYDIMAQMKGLIVQNPGQVH